jgi:hypothetical protein
VTKFDQLFEFDQGSTFFLDSIVVVGSPNGESNRSSH